ncbi:MAG: hypothetical protein ABEK36_02525 [Candidatus Aenigmatarchaeota archaeon]
MQWYFASRTKYREKINELCNFLRKNGQKIVYDWTNKEPDKVYSNNPDKCSVISEKISNSLSGVDVFVLISDKGGTDMFIEMGIAIGCWMCDKNIRIYAVGKYNNRSMMHHHPAIKRVESLEEVFRRETPEILGKNLLKILEKFKKHIGYHQ